jgi:hypothetical protein
MWSPRFEYHANRAAKAQLLARHQLTCMQGACLHSNKPAGPIKKTQDPAISGNMNVCPKQVVAQVALSADQKLRGLALDNECSRATFLCMCF